MHDETLENKDADQTLASSAVPYAPTDNPYRATLDTLTQPKPADVKAETRQPSILYPDLAKLPPAPPPPRPSSARERARRRRVRGRSQSDWAWVVIAATVLVVILMIGMSMMILLQTGDDPEVLPTAVADLSTLPTAVSLRAEDELASGGELVTLADGSSIIIEPWDGQGRFTMLVVGLDRRPGETGLTFRTDTMMLISLDPATGTIGILSIPRDLYVPIPGYANLDRINTPLVYAESYNPGTGPQVAKETVQYNLGIRVHHFLAVDFDAFIQMVDLIGGIDVTIDYTINDTSYPDLNYGYDPFYLAAGTHHLNGYDALRFARTRHGDSDFERAQRQQQVLYSVRDRVMNRENLPELIAMAPQLLQSWEDNVYTDLTLDQIIRLAWYAKDIPVENIHTGVIDYRYTQNYTTPRGDQVLVPNRSLLGQLMTEVFGANYSE
jgi:LCP family protein required for cell wall assembly